MDTKSKILTNLFASLFILIFSASNAFSLQENVRSRQLIIDIPGILTAGEEEPYKYNSIFGDPQKYNIRFEGIMGKKTYNSIPFLPGKQNEKEENIITLPNNWGNKKESLWKQLSKAIDETGNVYAKIDINLGLSIKWRLETQRASDVAGFLAKSFKKEQSVSRVILKLHSAGTNIPLMMSDDGLEHIDFIIAASPRQSISKWVEFAKKNPKIKILIITANADLPHWGVRGFGNIKLDNIVWVNLENYGSLLKPLLINAIDQHSKITDPALEDEFTIKTFNDSIKGTFVLGEIIKWFLNQEQFEKLRERKKTRIVEAEKKHFLGVLIRDEVKTPKVKDLFNITPEGQNWYLVQRAGWEEPIHVRHDTKEESAEDIADSVIEKARELGLGKGETVVVGGNSDSDKLKAIIKALEKKGFKVVVVNTTGVSFMDALLKIADKAHEVGALLGVLVQEKEKKSTEDEGEYKRYSTPTPCPPFCPPPQPAASHTEADGSEGQDKPPPPDRSFQSVESTEKISKKEEKYEVEKEIIEIGISEHDRPYIVVIVRGKKRVIWIPWNIYRKLKGKQIRIRILKVGKTTVILILVDGKPVWEIHVGPRGDIIWTGPPSQTSKEEKEDQRQRKGHKEIKFPLIPQVGRGGVYTVDEQNLQIIDGKKAGTGFIFGETTP